MNECYLFVFMLRDVLLLSPALHLTWKPPVQPYYFISLFLSSFLIRIDFSCSVRILFRDATPLPPFLFSFFPFSVFVHKIMCFGSHLFEIYTVLFLGFYEHKIFLASIGDSCGKDFMNVEQPLLLRDSCV